MRRIVFVDLVADEVFSAIAACTPPGFELDRIENGDIGHVVQKVTGADYLIVGWLGANAEVIEAAAPTVSFIQKLGIGVDKIAVELAQARGIPVAVTSGGNRTQVAEHAVMLMLAATRLLVPADTSLRQGLWKKAEFRVTMSELFEKRVGLLGFGNTGREVARRLKGFQTETVYYDVKRAPQDVEEELSAHYVELDELVTTSDIVSLHVPATDVTRGMFDAQRFATFKPGAYFVNTARGSLVVEADLIAALESGTLRGAGLDVTMHEPPRPDDAILSAPNVVLTPHIGGSSVENVARIATHAFRNIVAVDSGGSAPGEDLVPGTIAPRATDVVA